MRRFVPFVRDAFGVLAFAAILTVVSWRSYQRLSLVDRPNDPVRSAMCDFRDVVYYPARAAFAGVNPYDARHRPDGSGYRDRYLAGNPFPVYTPLVFLLSAPFAALPLFEAQVLFWLVNVGLLLVFAYVALRICGIDVNVGFVTGLAAVLLLSRPGHANLYFGQITLPMLLATLGAWHWARRRPMLSSLLLAVALVKPTYGGPLALLMLARGDYRAALTGLALTGLITVGALGYLTAVDSSGPAIWELLSHNQAATEDDPNVHPGQSGSRIDVPMVAERLLGEWSAPLTRRALPLLILAIAGWHLRLLGQVIAARGEATGPLQKRQIDSSIGLSASFLCLTIAICIYHGIYDGLLVTIPALAAWRAVIHRSSPWFWNGVLALCLSIPAVNYFSSRQFVALAAEYLPGVASGGSSPDGALWAVLCMLNGAALGIAWCILLVRIRGVVAAAPRITTV